MNLSNGLRRVIMLLNLKLNNMDKFPAFSSVINEDDSQKTNMLSDNERKFKEMFKFGKIQKSNLNGLAVELSIREGGKEQINIAQIKELLGMLGDQWRSVPFEEVMADVYAIIDRAG